MVEGAGDVFICASCIELCYNLVRDERRRAGRSTGPMKATPKPREILEFLGQYVIGQDIAKRTLAVAVHTHYKRLSHLDTMSPDDVEIDKSNVLLIGPTGSGKTLLARTLARQLNVPFAIGDATTLTEAGYVGEDVENVLLRLLQNADYDLEAAQRGIIYIDEIGQDRQDLEQRLHHARRQRRGRPAGPAEDARGDYREHPASGRSQAPRTAVHPA